MQKYGLVVGILVLLVVVFFPLNKPEQVNLLPDPVLEIVKSKPDPKSTGIVEKVRLDVEVTANQSGAASSATADSLYRLAEMAGFKNQNEKAEALYLSVIEIMRKKPPTDSVSLESSIYALVRLYLKQKKFKEALPLMEEKLKLMEKDNGSESWLLGDTIVAIASASIRTGDFKKAEKLLNRIDTLPEGPSPGYELFRIHALHHLGLVKDLQGLQFEARRLYHESLKRSQEARAKKKNKWSQGGVNGLSESDKRILSVYQDAVAVRERVFSPQSVQLVSVLSCLREFYETANWREKADEVSARLDVLKNPFPYIETVEEPLPSSSPLTAERLLKEAENLEKKGLPDKAEEKCLEALTQSSIEFGEFDGPRIAIYWLLHRLYESSKNGDSVEKNYELAIKDLSRKAPEGYDNPSFRDEILASFIAELSVHYIKIKNYGKAQVQFEKFLAVARSLPEKYCTFTTSNVATMASNYELNGEIKKAFVVYREYLGALETEHGPESLCLVSGLENFASFCEMREKYDEAELLHKRALNNREKSLGKNHHDVGWTLANLASHYFQRAMKNKGWLGDNRKFLNLTLHYYKRQLELYEGLYGKQDPQLSPVLTDLAMVYRELNKHELARELENRSASLSQKKEWNQK